MCSASRPRTIATLSRLAILASLTPLAILALGSGAVADVTYTYTGNAFDTIVSDDTPPSGSYTTSMSVDISLTLAQPIPANASNLVVSDQVLAYSFSDGRHTIDDGGTVLFAVSTDGDGEIVDWVATVESAVGPQSVDIGSNTNSDLDYGSVIEGGGTDAATATGNFGTWEATVVQPPPVPALGFPALLALAGAIAVLGSVVTSRAR